MSGYALGIVVPLLLSRVIIAVVRIIDRGATIEISVSDVRHVVRMPGVVRLVEVIGIVPKGRRRVGVSPVVVVASDAGARVIRRHGRCVPE